MEQCGLTRIFSVIILVLLISTAALAGAGFAEALCDDENHSPLFVCETGQGKFIMICAIEEEPGQKWSAVQYQFGRQGAPELVYPRDPAEGSKRLFFSHEMSKGWYRVTVRFTVGEYTYKVYSYSRGRMEGDAGVLVLDRKGRKVADIGCIERPYIFPSYLQRALACDLTNPHGKAACYDSPYKGKE